MSNALDRDTLEEGEVIFSKGDEPDYAYLIQSGGVDIVLEKDGRTIHIDTLGEGEFFGEMALVDDEPRSATATAIAPTTCVKIARRDFLERLGNSEPLTRIMLELLVKRLRKSTEARGAA